MQHSSELESDSTPTISVVMPVFNGAETIKESLESVFLQSLQPTEIIVVDDGSNDNTLNILTEYEDRITVIKQQKQGHAVARNVGIQQSNSEFIAVLDADDLWVSNKLEKQIAECVDADVVYTGAVNFGNSERVAQDSNPPCLTLEDDALSPLLVDNFITHSSVLMRRESALAVGGYDTSLRTAPDWDLWLRMAQKHMRFKGLSESLVRYRWVPTSVSKNHTQTCKDRIKVISAAIERADTTRVSQHTRRKAIYNAWRTSAWFAANDQPLNAFKWYVEALKVQPTSSASWKDVIKTALYPLGLRAS